MEHGIKYSERPTSIVSMLETERPTVVIGTCAIHTATNPAPVNEPVLCTSFAEYREQFGYTGDFDTFTCDEAAYTHFALYNIRNLIVINVLDPATHIADTATTTELTDVSKGSKVVKNALAMLSGITVKSGSKDLTAGTDYTLSYDGADLVFKLLQSTNVTGDKVTLTYKKLTPSTVTETQVKNAPGKIAQVFPKLGMVPGVLIMPRWSTNVKIATLMETAMRDINGVFNGISIADLPTAADSAVSVTSGCSSYTDCYSYKTDKGLQDKDLVLCWPKVKMEDDEYHLSSHLAALMHSVDNDYDGVPTASPSNHALQITGLCTKGGGVDGERDDTGA